jgi:hypothetical protein
MTPARVGKRDGREVPFDESKIGSAIARAMAAVGEPDDGFAAEVAGVVRMTLEDRHGASSVPGIEEIQDLVEQALIELGRSRVAKAYILYRDQRARARAALVEDAPRAGGAARDRRGVARVQVRESEGTSPWSKGRIVAALMREADLSRELSEKVAARVETRVFQAGLPHLTTALVRELVEAELLSMGLENARRRQTSFGLPAFDLRRLIETPPREFETGRPVPAELLASSRVESTVGAEVLHRFALQELLGDELGERHRSGDLFVHELGAPHRPLWISIPAAALTARASAEGAFELLGELAALADGAAYGMALEDPLPVLAPLAAGRGPGLAAWLRALTATARGLGRRLELSSPGLRSPALLERLVADLAALDEDAFAPRLFVDERELAYLADRDGLDLDRLLVTGRVVATWTSGGERMVAPGCQRGPGERAAVTCGAAVSINLPRIALRAGPWREDRLLELLSGTVDDAVRAALALINSRRGSRHLGGRVSAAVAPVGLREALQTTGDGAVDPELGARVLGFLADALGRAERTHRLRVVLSPCFGEGPATRFAELDQRLPQRGQRLLFEGAAEQGAGSSAASERLSGGGGPYSTGYRLSSPARAFAEALDGWPGEARLTSTVAVGALTPLPIPSSHWVGGLYAGHTGSAPGASGDLRVSIARALLACLAQRAEPNAALVPAARAEREEPALFPEPMSSPGRASSGRTP